MKVRIDQAGWHNFSGMMGSVRFENGEAELANIYEARRIGSLIRLIELDDEGEPIRVRSPTSEMLETRGLSAEVIPSRRVEPVVEDEAPVEETEEDEEPEEAVERYTEEQLAEIADASGIAGLREIAGPLDIKGTSIHGLIEAILAVRGGE